MKITIAMPEKIAAILKKHFFQNELEQGAFLFARSEESPECLTLHVEDYHLVPPTAWEVQLEIYLQMRDSERAKIMKIARDRNLCAIDCHSHPRGDESVWFSPSDVAGISEFAEYAKWKLSGRPFAALVWGERSVDGVAWFGDFGSANAINEVHVEGSSGGVLRPTNSWFGRPRGKHRFSYYE